MILRAALSSPVLCVSLSYKTGVTDSREKSRPPQAVFWQDTTAVMTASSGVWQIPSPEMQEPKSPVQGWPLCGPLVSCIPSCSLHLMVQSPLRVIIDISRHPQYSNHDFPNLHIKTIRRDQGAHEVHVYIFGLWGATSRVKIPTTRGRSCKSCNKFALFLWLLEKSPLQRRTRQY